MSTPTTATLSWNELLTTGGVAAAAVAAAGALITFAVNLLGARRKAKRERYARAVVNLAAWAEMPYRIRRRPANSAECRQELAARMHSLQEQLLLDRAELTAEAPWLGRRYAAALDKLRASTGPWFQAAWEADPADTDVAMNLGDWGPRHVEDVVLAFQQQLPWRFGWRWLVNPVRLAVGWARRRFQPWSVTPKACPPADSPAG